MKFLIKTFKEPDLQYAKNLLSNGELFFQHVSVYRKIEDNNIRGDNDEGSVLETYELNIPPHIKTLTIGNRNGGKIFIADLERARKGIPDLRGQEIQSIRIKYVVDCLIYCMTYIDNELENQNEIIDGLQHFGKYSVIIQLDEFTAKVNSMIKCEKGLVCYSDNGTLDPFTKRKNYSWQSEYRLCIAAEGYKQKLISIGRLSGFICESNATNIIKKRLHIRN